MRRSLLKKLSIILFLLHFLIFLFLFPKSSQIQSISWNDFLQPYLYPVSCHDLFNNQTVEFERTSLLLSKRVFQSVVIQDEKYIFPNSFCSTYLSLRFNEKFHQNDSWTNQQFPLAFSILLHENVEQFERLLRLIYRRQNFYCVHIDADASMNVVRAIQSISQCFDNVFVSSRRESIIYASFSRLQADLNCMSDLIQFPSWIYLLNIVNSELPLRTNSELVEILKIYRGFNDIEGRWKTRLKRRTNYVWKMSEIKTKSYSQKLKMTNVRKSAPPRNLEIVKGSAYGAFSRSFVEFVLSSSIAQELLDWSRDTYSPDEHFWSTLNYNPHVYAPGSYKAKSDPTEWTSRFVNWGEFRCHGRIQRTICIFGFADLPLLSSRHEFIANKFQLKVDPIAYQCQEERIIERSRNDLVQTSINLSIYERMPFLLD